MIIGISGKRGVGKTVAAKYLVKHHGFIRLSFADELRRLARVLLPFTEADFTDIRKKESPFLDYDWTPREFMIQFGEFMRYYDQDYWARSVLDRLDLKKDYVIDDLRFPNEYDLLKEKEAVIIRINRFEKDNPYGKNLDVPSEKALDNHTFDYVIEDCRNTTLGRLYDEVEHVVTSYT